MLLNLKVLKIRVPTIVGSSSPGRRQEILKPDYFEPEYAKPEEPKPENPGPEDSEYRYSDSGFWGFDFRIWGKNLHTYNLVEIVKPWTLDPEPTLDYLKPEIRMPGTRVASIPNTKTLIPENLEMLT